MFSYCALPSLFQGMGEALWDFRCTDLALQKYLIRGLSAIMKDQLNAWHARVINAFFVAHARHWLCPPQ